MLTTLHLSRVYTATIGFWIALLYPLTGRADCPQADSAQVPLNSATLTVATLNIAHGRRDSLNQMLLSREQIEQNLHLAAFQLKDTGADVIALQEADAPSRWSGGFDHVDIIASAANRPCYFHGLHDTSSFSSYGTALLARAPLQDSISHTFAPSWPTKPKGFVLSRLHWNPADQLDQPVSVALVSVHMDFSRNSVRAKQTAEMIDALRDIEGPLVIMGDFNSEWSVDDSAVRQLAKALDLHTFAPFSTQLGTYVSKNVRLDWILASKDLGIERYEVVQEMVSDHLTVVAQFGLREQPEGASTR